jgi:hypothetical protein
VIARSVYPCNDQEQLRKKPEATKENVSTRFPTRLVSLSQSNKATLITKILLARRLRLASDR